ncbi:MAG: hypothetical protein JWL77_3524 [Chthonomonadaceae bacterium]|nr:hypothetical protein [Chthonomonadaceae bacterium]
MIPEELRTTIDETVPAGVTHIGFVPVNQDGQYLVAEPNGHPYGVSATFSKVKRLPEERPSASLVRCLQEQVGHATVSVYPVGNVWVTPNNVSCYFAGFLSENAEAVNSETASLRWCNAEEARTRLQNSSSAVSRQRDMALITTLETMCVSPYRNVLLMVRELHRMGFERLRAYTYMHAVGTWRCAIAPSAWIHDRSEQTPLAMPFDLTYTVEDLLGSGASVHFYTSANEQRIFENSETWFMSPRALAEQYLKRFPAIAAVGFGPDPEYAAWYERTLDLLAPNGIFYAFAEFQAVTDSYYTLMAPVRHAPLPPPGHLDPECWIPFLERHTKSAI